MSTGEPSASSPGLMVRDDNVILIREDHEHAAGYIVTCLEEKTASSDDHSPYKLSNTSIPEVPATLKHLLLAQCPQHLAQQRVSVVVSTKSGTGLALWCWETVVKPLLDMVLELGPAAVDGGKHRGCEVIVTRSAGTVKEFARTRMGSGGAASSGTVILLSGDGGIVDLLNGAREETRDNPPAVAILPLGTGNALFHSLHKPLYTRGGPSPLVHGLRTMLSGRPEPLPVFRATFSPGATLVPVPDDNGNDEQNISSSEEKENEEPEPEPVDHLLGAIVASYGFHANIVWESDTPEYRPHGTKRFGMVARNLLHENHAYRATVAIRKSPGGGDARSPFSSLSGSSEFSYVLAAMVSNLEKDFSISPASKPLDGRLRLVHFAHRDGPEGGVRTWDIMMAAYDEGRHVQREDVGYDEVEEVRVEVNEEEEERWRKVCVDGTIVQVERGGWMRVVKAERSPLRVLVRTH